MDYCYDVPLTDSKNEHLFASYYGINSWSADQRYVTVLQTPIKYRLPTENDPATLGLVDLETGEAKLLVSIHDMKAQVPDVPEDGIGYFNHMLFTVGQQNYKRLGK